MADALIEKVAAIAADAGAMALGRVGETGWEKAPGQPVSKVDLDADALIRRRLAEIDPEAGWLSEESAASPDRLARRRVCIVDPIDGTRDYLRGRPGWAVSIALIEDGRPVLGVLDAPARGERWQAVREQRATLNGSSIRASGRTMLPGARVAADVLPKVDADLVAVPRPNSIALRIAMVASGEVDLLAALRWGFEWDIAAATLIAEEAGATVTDALGAGLRFNAEKPEAFGVVAAAPGIHAAAIERLAERAERARIR